MPKPWSVRGSGGEADSGALAPAVLASSSWSRRASSASAASCWGFGRRGLGEGLGKREEKRERGCV